MTTEELTLMGWRRMEFKPALSLVVFLYSWSLIPIAISLLILGFDKFNGYLYHACMSAIILQFMSLYLAISKRKISLQYNSIRNSVITAILITFMFIAIRFSQTEYVPVIQIILTMVFSYNIFKAIQIYANNIGSTFEHSWNAKEKLLDEKLSNWNIQSYIFSNSVMASREFTESDCIAWISGKTINEEPFLILEIFGHNPKDEFDFSSLQIDFD
ncbi:MAG: hypothetical protein NZ736_03635 [Candidatus Poseidoniaceae archaeon]|nr:hypothetical protein [Candidatus Poseidoniaceae archaeon]